VDAVGGDDNRGGEGPPVAGCNDDVIGLLSSLHDFEARQKSGSRLDRERHQQGVELDAPNHQGRGRPGVDQRRVSVRPFELKSRNRVDADPRQLSLEIGKPSQEADADSHAAGLVPRKGRAIEHRDRNAGPGQRPRGRCASRTGADDQHGRPSRRWRYG